MMGVAIGPGTWMDPVAPVAPVDPSSDRGKCPPPSPAAVDPSSDPAALPHCTYEH
jgi:hypothetical protein